jgi:hypothetical protein
MSDSLDRPRSFTLMPSDTVMPGEPLPMPGTRSTSVHSRQDSPDDMAARKAPVARSLARTALLPSRWIFYALVGALILFSLTTIGWQVRMHCAQLPPELHEGFCHMLLSVLLTRMAAPAHAHAAHCAPTPPQLLRQRATLLHFASHRTQLPPRQPPRTAGPPRKPPATAHADAAHVRHLRRARLAARGAPAHRALQQRAPALPQRRWPPLRAGVEPLDGADDARVALGSRHARARHAQLEPAARGPRVGTRPPRCCTRLGASGGCSRACVRHDITCQRLHANPLMSSQSACSASYAWHPHLRPVATSGHRRQTANHRRSSSSSTSARSCSRARASCGCRAAACSWCTSACPRRTRTSSASRSGRTPARCTRAAAPASRARAERCTPV